MQTITSKRFNGRYIEVYTCILKTFSSLVGNSFPSVGTQNHNESNKGCPKQLINITH